MNEYQRAFLVLREHATFETVDELIVMKELVEKATPKKVELVSREEYMETGYKHSCFTCGNKVGTITKDLNIEHDNYCPSCGQRLDWSEVDEE